MTICVFFDTEFTTLNVNGYPELISIGLVSDDGKEFYAELTDTWYEGICSQFAIDFVLPLLEGGEARMTEAQLAVALKTWIEAFGDEEIVLRSDAPGMDWPWLANIFNAYAWPNNLRKKCGPIYFRKLLFQHRFNMGLESFWSEHFKRKHHALVDAKSLQ